MTITSNSFPKKLQPGLKASFDGLYASANPIWRQIFKDETSNKKYEDIISEYSFGLASEVGEGSPIPYDNISQGLSIRFTHQKYGIGAIVSEEAVEDNLYENIINKVVEKLKRSHVTTEEYKHADVLNSGFTVANNHQQGGDGQYLFDTDHTARSGTYSNLLTASTLSRTSLEDAMIQVALTKDETGIYPAGLMSKRLIVPKNLEYTAQEILRSEKQPENANNAINTMKGIMPYISWQFLDSTYGGSDTAWFIQTDCPEGLIHYTRRKARINFSNDDENEVQKVLSSQRYACGVIDVRACFGNAGV